MAGSARRASAPCHTQRQAELRPRQPRPPSAGNAAARRCFAARSGRGRPLLLRRTTHQLEPGTFPRNSPTLLRSVPRHSAASIAESSGSRSGSPVAAALEIGAYAMRRRGKIWRVGAIGSVGVRGKVAMVMRISVRISVRMMAVPMVPPRPRTRWRRRQPDGRRHGHSEAGFQVSAQARRHVRRGPLEFHSVTAACAFCRAGQPKV
jgi:hypothetical protein